MTNQVLVYTPNWERVEGVLSYCNKSDPSVSLLCSMQFNPQHWGWNVSTLTIKFHQIFIRPCVQPSVSIPYRNPLGKTSIHLTDVKYALIFMKLKEHNFMINLHIVRFKVDEIPGIGCHLVIGLLPRCPLYGIPPLNRLLSQSPAVGERCMFSRAPRTQGYLPHLKARLTYTPRGFESFYDRIIRYFDLYCRININRHSS